MNSHSEDREQAQQHAEERIGRLVIGRFEGQGIYIGRDVCIRIVDVNRRTGHVRIAIDAPQGIAISRDSMSIEEHLRWQQRRERMVQANARGGRDDDFERPVPPPRAGAARTPRKVL